MKRASIIIAVVALVLTAGGALGAQVDSSGLHYPLDARRAAIVYGNSIQLSDSLVLKIDSELVLLRRQGFDSIVNLPFALPWAAGELVIETDAPYLDGFLTKNHEQWRNLANKYDLEIKKVESSYVWHDYTRRLQIISSVPFNSYQLAQEFVGMEHVKAVRTLEPYEGLHDFYQLWARSSSGNNAHYFFKTYACYDSYFRYGYFEVRNDTAQCLGNHWECLPSSNFKSAMGGEIEFLLSQAYIDDAEVNKPAWVDTARVELGKILHYANWNQFRWTRGVVTK